MPSVKTQTDDEHNLAKGSSQYSLAHVLSPKKPTTLSGILVGDGKNELGRAKSELDLHSPDGK